MVEKRHLVLRRHIADDWRCQHGTDLIDLGTDYRYPFYDSFAPTAQALRAIKYSTDSARHYPSSYGTAELRDEFAAFMLRQFRVKILPDTEVMITTGASQVFDALSRSYAGRYVLLPDFALSTVNSIATGNGAEIIRVPLDDCLRPNLIALADIIARIDPSTIRFLYINSPMNPTGVVLDYDYMRDLVELAQKHSVLVLHDHDSWFTTHTVDCAPNILEIDGAKEVAVSVLSVSKELGLPGIRVGMLAGCPEVINTIRIHNSEFCVMIPEFSQAAAAAALRESSNDTLRQEVQELISRSLATALQGLRRLGWPDSAVMAPAAGYKFLFRPPSVFANYLRDGVSGVELFDYVAGRKAGVKLSTSRSFNIHQIDWMRLVLMQSDVIVFEAFERLARAGIHYDMTFPRELATEHLEFVRNCEFWEL